jgi:hypothetical protein
MPGAIQLLLVGVLAAPVDIALTRASGAGHSVTYQFTLRNGSGIQLHNFMIGTTLSDSCPDLREPPAGWSDTTNCPPSIVVPKPWIGCVNSQEDCDGCFLVFDYDPETFGGLAPGDSLRFAVTVAKPDSSYEHASFWVNSDDQVYLGRVRQVQHPMAPSGRRTPEAIHPH